MQQKGPFSLHAQAGHDEIVAMIAEACFLFQEEDGVRSIPRSVLERSESKKAFLGVSGGHLYRYILLRGKECIWFSLDSGGLDMKGFDQTAVKNLLVLVVERALTTKHCLLSL